MRSSPFRASETASSMTFELERTKTVRLDSLVATSYQDFDCKTVRQLYSPVTSRPGPESWPGDSAPPSKRGPAPPGGSCGGRPGGEGRSAPPGRTACGWSRGRGARPAGEKAILISEGFARRLRDQTEGDTLFAPRGEEIAGVGGG
jgi:hypothetical protein